MTSNSDIIKKTRPVFEGFTTYLQVFFCLIIASFIAGAPSSIYEAASGNPLFFELNYGEPLAFSDESVLISSIVLLLVFYLSASIQVGISLFCLDIYNGKGINFSTLFGSFSTLKPLAITILLTLIIGVGFILLIIPGIILGLMYSQAYYILAEEPNIAVLEALKKSEKMMKGKKMQLFMLTLRAMLYFILGVFTLFIWWIWLVPRYSVAFAGFYEELKKDFNN
mgnify:FL=1|tara:strand:+ start:1556 stop:2227 length:672 start_codon:yes stop_codon:yes gene_type:complete